MNTSFILQRNNVRIKGKGSQPMLFAHGFGCDQNMWRFVAPAFEEEYQVILFDYVGAGKSDLTAYNTERYANLYGYAQDVLEICRALQLENVIFVGHSVSSMIGVLAALQEPERFASLIMVGPSPRYINDTQGYYGGFERHELEGLLDTMDKNYIGWANFLAPVLINNPQRPELAQELHDSFCSTDPIIARQFAEVTFFSDNRADLPRVSLPVLIMQCSDDLIAPTSVGEYLASVIPSNHFVQLQATGHCPHMSAPEETIQVIRDYLQHYSLSVV